MGLRAKFRLTVGMAACGLLVLSGMWLHSERAHMMAEKQEQAMNLVALPLSVMAEQYQLEQAGKISRWEVQRKVIEALRGIRYDGNNYFWIIDMHPRMVMHPTKPELEGRDLTEYRDEHGTALFVEMVQAVQRDGGGFVRYRWPRPGTQKKGEVSKLSYVRGFAPWGWIVGTGIYIDDVNADWGENAATAAVVTAVCLIALVLISAGISRSMFRRLRLVVDRMKEIGEGKGDFSRGIESKGRRADRGQETNWT